MSHIPRNMTDCILIEELRIEACVGVPDEERDSKQELAVSILMEPSEGLRDLGWTWSRPQR